MIGGGNIGGTLGRKWAAAGHAVTFGLRDPASGTANTLRDAVPGASVGWFEEAAGDADVVLLAVPGDTLGGVVATIGADLDGRIVIDATNNLGGETMHGIDSITAAAPDARVFRAFCTLGWENFDQPTFADGTADLFYCGPDGDADAVMQGLVDAVGLRPVRVGDLDQVNLIDNLTRLWFALAMGQRRGRHLAFKLLAD